MSCPALRFSPWSLSDYPVYVLPRTMETPKWKPSLVFYLHAQIYRNPPPPTTTATTTTMKPYSPMVIKLHPSHLLYIEGSGKGNGNGTIRPCRANHSMNKELVFGPPNSVRLHVCMCVKRRLCGKAGTRASSGTFMRAVGRVGDLTGVLVNASLRTEGQKALLQVPSPPPPTLGTICIEPLELFVYSTYYTLAVCAG